jgi:hypothetical protein
MMRERRICRTATQQGYSQVAAALGCVRELRRELVARSSTSRPLAAASAFSASSCVTSFRAAGPHARLSSDGSALIAYAEQSPASATAKQAFPRSQRRSLPRSQRRSLVERRRTAAAPGERECEPREDNLLAADRGGCQAASTTLEAGSERKTEKKDGDFIRRPSQTRRIEGVSSGKFRPVASRRHTCVVSKIAGHTRSHTEARCDLHDRTHAHPLRRSGNELTLELPLLLRAGGPARRSSA